MANVVEMDERRVEAFLARLAEIEPVERRRRRRTGLVPRAAIAVAIVVAALAVVLPLPGDRLDTETAAARALERVARVAAAQPVVADDGRYTYSRTLSKSRITYGAPRRYAAVRFVREELWLAPNGSGRVRTVSGPLRFPSAQARAEWEAHGDWISTEPSDRRFRLRPHFRSVEELPADADQLTELLREESERASSGKRGVAPYESFEHLMFARLVGVLAPMNSEINRRPALRAAFFRAVARFEGTQLLGRMLDPAGRRGVGVGFEILGQRSVLIFDPRTSRILALKEVVLEPARYPELGRVPPGYAIAWTAYLEAARVDSLTDRPGVPSRRRS